MNHLFTKNGMHTGSRCLLNQDKEMKETEAMEDLQEQLFRYERRLDFGWCHRITPFLVIQALVVCFVTKSRDIYFDVTGIVIFNLVLLFLVTTFHLLVWEILTRVRHHSQNYLEEFRCMNIKAINDLTELANSYSVLNGVKCSKSNLTRGSFHFENVEPELNTKGPFLDKTGSSGSTFSSNEDSSVSPSSSTSSLSTTVSHTYDEDSSLSASSSYCILSGAASGNSSSGSSGFDSDSSTTSLVDSNPADSNIDQPVGVVSTIYRSSLPPDAPTSRGGNHVNIKTKTVLDIPSDRSTADVESRGDCNPYHERSIKAASRLKSLQDVYLVVDLFKALICLDTLRHLWFYFSLYYWRMSIIPTVQCFVLPSLVVFVEVSLTVICYIP